MPENACFTRFFGCFECKIRPQGQTDLQKLTKMTHMNIFSNLMNNTEYFYKRKIENHPQGRLKSKNGKNSHWINFHFVAKVEKAHQENKVCFFAWFLTWLICVKLAVLGSCSYTKAVSLLRASCKMLIWADLSIKIAILCAYTCKLHTRATKCLKTPYMAYLCVFYVYVDNFLRSYNLAIE